MKAAGYPRVSTEDQRDRQTIQTQIEELKRYCAQHGLELYDLYPDDGISDTVPFDQRPGGARLLQDARAGHFHTVLVYKLDRLGRDPLVTFLAVDQLKKLGVSVQSTTQSFDADDPTGRLLMTILSGVAGFERETIIQRSIAGTNRLAREGAWLSGIVPYGYRVEGKGPTARLVIADEPLPGLSMSEAGVVRLIYRLAVEERLSCMKIADRLNALGVPPAYICDGRVMKRGKRLGATAGIWRAGRVRNMLVNTTYKGIHTYGQRSKKQREQIERSVPAIVTPETWEQAQHTLRLNYRLSERDNRQPYLLRGLVKCGLCGLNYIGSIGSAARLPYYKCSGQTNARGLYGLNRHRCPSKALRADQIETIIWQDIEGFLRDPGAVLDTLAEQIGNDTDAAELRQGEVNRLAGLLAVKTAESDTVISLFRRGRINQAQLDRQLDQIDREEQELRTQLEQARACLRAAANTQVHLRSADVLLRELSQRLDQPLTWEVKRQLVEALVPVIQVDTVEDGGKREARVEITYAFGSVENYMDSGSSPRPRWGGLILRRSSPSAGPATLDLGSADPARRWVRNEASRKDPRGFNCFARAAGHGTLTGRWTPPRAPKGRWVLSLATYRSLDAGSYRAGSRPEGASCFAMPCHAVIPTVDQTAWHGVCGSGPFHNNILSH